MSGQRGHTYIEMIAVIGITLVLAMLIVPNLVGQRDSRSVWDFRTRLIDLAKEARSTAIESGDTVALYYQENPKAVREVAELNDGTQHEIRDLELPEAISTTKFDADTNEASNGQWRLPFFADGGTAGGGIEFAEGGRTFSFSIARSDRSPTVKDGPLPDLSLDQWPAGSNNAIQP
jgi:type II secretory pathway pseudopilin PulG